MNQKEKIKYREKINKNKLKYIKNFYITKFKKYLSIIKHSNDISIQDFKKDIDLSFIDNDKISLEIQQSIFKENDKLNIFFNENISKYFMNLNFKYTNDEINSINGIDNIYDSKYEKIKIYSDFNFKDASDVILYIFISELNEYILCVSNYKEQSLNIINEKNTRCKYICNFIMILLEELDEDYELLNICNGETEKVKNILIHQIIEDKIKQTKSDDENYMITTLSRLFKKSTTIDDLDEKIEYDEELDTKEKIDIIMEEGKKKLKEKYGYEPTEDQLETYKNDYLQNLAENDDYNNENYNLDNTAKGVDVIDQGANYGDFNEYDFENGDGFNYAEQEEEFYE